MDKDKELCGLLGIEWHELRDNPAYVWDEKQSPSICSCGVLHCRKTNPAFTSPEGIVQLLGIMSSRGDWKEFLMKSAGFMALTNNGTVHLIDPFKLRDAATDFLKSENLIRKVQWYQAPF